MLTFVLSAAAACGSVKQMAADASPAGDAPAPDAPAPDGPTCPTRLLTGGTDIAPQGWSLVTQAPAQLTNGPDYVKLQTATNNGALSGGQLLITYPGAVEMSKPFKIQVVMLVEAVNLHNQFDAAAAILGSFGGGAGIGNDRDEMIYLDPAKIGWADDTQSFPFTVTDNAYHTYELSVDAGGAATVSVDGTRALTRNGFTTNGAIAIGDQTNDPNVDGTLRIRSVTRLCL